MISALEPMSTPRGRLVEDEDVRLGVQPLADDDLLLVSAGERADRSLARGGLDPQALDLPVCGFAGPGGRHEQPRGEPVEDGKGGVGLDRVFEHEPLPQPILRHEREAVRDRVDRALDLDRRALDADFTRSLWIDPEQHARQRATSAAEQARDADNLAGVEREIDDFRLARAAEATRFEKRRRRARRAGV